jgi:hypothetical protein
MRSRLKTQTLDVTGLKEFADIMAETLLVIVEMPQGTKEMPKDMEMYSFSKIKVLEVLDL